MRLCGYNTIGVDAIVGNIGQIKPRQCCNKNKSDTRTIYQVQTYSKETYRRRFCADKGVKRCHGSCNTCRACETWIESDKTQTMLQWKQEWYKYYISGTETTPRKHIGDVFLLTRGLSDVTARAVLVEHAKRGYCHPTVEVALFGWNVSERLSPSREELPVCNDNFTSIMVLVLAHWGVGRVARTNFFEVMFRVRYWAPHVKSSEIFPSPSPWDDSIACKRTFLYSDRSRFRRSSSLFSLRAKLPNNLPLGMVWITSPIPHGAGLERNPTA